MPDRNQTSIPGAVPSLQGAAGYSGPMQSNIRYNPEQPDNSVRDRVLSVASGIAGKLWESSVNKTMVGASADASKGVSKDAALDKINPFLRPFAELSYDDTAAASELRSRVLNLTGNLQQDAANIPPADYAKHVTEVLQKDLPAAGTDRGTNTLLGNTDKAIAALTEQHATQYAKHKLKTAIAETNSSIRVASVQHQATQLDPLSTPEQQQLSGERTYRSITSAIADPLYAGNPELQGTLYKGAIRTVVQQGDYKLGQALLNAPEAASLDLKDVAALQELIDKSESKRNKPNQLATWASISEKLAMLKEGDAAVSAYEIAKDIQAIATTDPEAYKGLFSQYIGIVHSKADESKALTAWYSGDPTRVALEADTAKGAKAFLSSIHNTNGGDTADTITQGLVAAHRYGSNSMYKEIGSLVGSYLNITSTSSDQELSKAAQALKPILGAILAGTSDGAPNPELVHILAGMPEQQQAKLLSIIEQSRVNPDVNIGTALAVHEQVTIGKGVIKNQQQDLIVPAMVEEDVASIVGTTSGAYRAWGATTDALRSLAGRPKVNTIAIADTPAAAAEQKNIRDEYVRAYSSTDPNATQASRRTMAMANLSSRIVKIDRPGSLAGVPQDILPNFSGNAISVLPEPAPKYFKGAINVDSNTISTALTGLLLPVDKHTATITFDSNGMTVRYFSELTGGEEEVLNRTYTKAELVQRINNTVEGALSNTQSALTGTGVDGVRVSGLNSRNVEPTLMHEARAKLVQFEGYLKEPNAAGYAGISIQRGDPDYPQLDASGKVTPEEASKSFEAYTDKLAGKVKATASDLGFDSSDRDAFLFLMDFGYHAGANWRRTRNELYQAIQSGDPEAAYSALQETPEYKEAGPERKKFRLGALMAAMTKGNPKYKGLKFNY